MAYFIVSYIPWFRKYFQIDFVNYAFCELSYAIIYIIYFEMSYIKGIKIKQLCLLVFCYNVQ